MSELQQIGQNIASIVLDAKTSVSLLNAQSQRLKQILMATMNSLQGSSQGNYKNMVNCFQDTLQKIDISINSLTAVITSGENWIQNHTISHRGSSTMNSMSSPFLSTMDGYVDGSSFPIQTDTMALSNVALSKMNPNRVSVAVNAFCKAPQSIVDELNSHADRLQPTMDTGYSLNENGQRVKDGCYYSPNDHQVRMDETLSDEEYGEILPHELSHFLDHERGWESRSPEFVNAVQADYKSMDKTTVAGRAKMKEMLDDAFSTGAAYDRNVSDIISAVFVNDPEIVQRFWEEGVPYYCHDNKYWANDYAREAEIYANNGAVRCSDERISKNFLERYFSHSYNQFGSFYNLDNQEVLQ